jgi:hypothetical protein
MNRANVSSRATFVATVASSLFALSVGCSTGGTPVAVAPVSLPANPRSIEPPAQPGSTASANNARDLANAQPEAVLDTKPSARDLDLNGGDTGSAQPLTYAALGATLQKMGLTPEDDKTYYEMKVKAKTDDGMEWTFPIDVSLSKDQSVIWITCVLCQIDKNGAPSSQSLIDLLSANQQMGISFFVLGQNHTLLLQQPFDNVGVTPQILGENLKGYFSNLKQAEPIFKAFFAPPSGGGQGGGGGNPFQ